MKYWFLLLLAPFAYAHDTSIVGPKDVDMDTRGFPSTLKASIPDFTLNALDEYQIVLRQYVANGDDDVVASPVYGDIAPTIVAGGTQPTGCTLTTTDLDLATYDCTNVSAGSGTLTLTFDNSVGSPLVETVNWSVDAGATEAETITQGARAFFVANNGADSNAGNTVSSPWRTSAKVASFLASASAQAGDDFYFKAGDTFPGAVTFPIKSGGASAVADRQIFGSYYCDDANICAAGQAIVNKPTNFIPSRRPSEFTYLYPRPIIQGTYLQSCRIADGNFSDAQTGPLGTLVAGGPLPGKKCAMSTTGFTVGTKGTYGPVVGQLAVPGNGFGGLAIWTFDPGKKYVSVQDISVMGSAGYGIVIGRTGGPSNCYGANATACDIEMILDRIEIGYSGLNPGNTSAVSKIAFRYFYIHNGHLSYPDNIRGFTNGGGGNITPNNCAPCQILMEAFDTYRLHHEAQGFYGASHILSRGFFVGSHSMSGGVNSDVIHEQNLMIGTIDVVSPPSTKSRFPFWGLSNEMQSVGKLWPTLLNYPTTVPGSGNINRNNIVTSGKSHLLIIRDNEPCCAVYSPSAFSSFTGATVGNTFVAGSQTAVALMQFRDFANTCTEINEDGYVGVGNSVAMGCATKPKGTMVSMDFRDNLFVVQSGYSQSAAELCTMNKGTLGTFTAGYNQFTQAPSSSCAGTGDVISANTGLPVVDVISKEWTGPPAVFPLTATEMTPSGGAGLNAGTPLTSTALIDTGTEWDWVLAQRVWLPACNTTGAQVPKAEWIKLLTTDYCGNARSATTPDMGAIEHN